MRQSTALCSNTFGLWFLVVCKHLSPPCVSNTFGLWILVCAHASDSSPVFQTRLVFGSVSLCKHQTTAIDQTRLDCGSLLYASIVSTLCFKHVWIVDPCPRTCINLQPYVLNVFGLWFRVFVQASVCVSNTFRLWSLVCGHALVSNPVFLTRLDCGSLSVHTHLSPAFCSNTFDYGCLLVYPPARTKMKVTPELEKKFHRARAPNQLSTFLETEQLLGVDDLALVCTKQELLDETLIAPAKAAGVPCDSLAEKVCIKKVWALCSWRRGQPASQMEQEDQVLPDEVKRSLDGQWEACHGFVLNTFGLLSETQQNKICRMSHCAPRAFPIVLLESMRLLCRLSDGKPVKTASSTRDSNVAEEVSGVFELWTRLRAFFTTLAYTSIDQKDWFGFGECEQFVDQVFQWLHLRHSGQRAPIQFYIDPFNSSQRSEATER